MSAADLAARGLQPGYGAQRREDDTTSNLANRADESLGRNGMVIIADTNAHTPAEETDCFAALVAMTDAVIAAATADDSAPITGTIAGLGIPAGGVVYGKFVSVTLTSGTVIAYIGAI